MLRHKLKSHARELVFASHKPHVFSVTFLYILIVMMLAMIIGNLSDFGRVQAEMLDQMWTVMADTVRIGENAAFSLPVFRVTLFGSFFFVASTLLAWMVDLGYLYYARGIVRADSGLGYRSLLEGFNYFAKAVLLRLISGMAISLGMLLFVLPGLIFSAAFSQVNLLLLDYPDKSVRWYFGESVRLMNGHKREYLFLQLSFIGWIFLQALPFLGHAVRVFLTPYMSITFVNYYHHLTGRGPENKEDGWQRPGMF